MSTNSTLPGWARSSLLFQSAFTACEAEGLTLEDIFDGLNNALELARFKAAEAVQASLSDMWDADVKHPGERLTPALARALICIEQICAGAESGVFLDIFRASLPSLPAGGGVLSALADILFDAARGELPWTQEGYESALADHGGFVVLLLLQEDAVENRLFEIAGFPQGN